jgi:mannose-6-phosphate isomerase-like protein (cupin superfamily)
VLNIAGSEHFLVEGEHMNLPLSTEPLRLTVVNVPTILVRVTGRWGAETGGCGVFTLEPGAVSRNTGDPVDYPRSTDFDVHYHDCDEYWIIFDGRGKVMTEGNHYDICAGDCVATGIGHHHDISHVEETLHGVYFETTLEGERRSGHLWNHTHGPTHPKWERV